MSASIPIVDLSPAFGTPEERRLLGEELCSIYHDIGFAVITNHGLPEDFFTEVFSMMDDFFALPEEEKLQIDKRRSRHFRGWEALGTEFTNNRPDVREQIDLWTDGPALAADVEPSYLRLLGPNQWMPDTFPALQTVWTDWFEKMSALADRVLGLFSLGLGLEEEHLFDFFGDASMSLTKFINYPPTPAGGAGVNAHHDTGFLTLLAAGTTPGLQVLDPAGEWIDVPIVPNSLVVNIGEMLQALTGNYLTATAHRVITSEARKSAAYFHGPSLDTRLEPLELDERFHAAVTASERHRSAGFMATREQTDEGVGDMASTTKADTYGRQLWNYFARSYPEMMATHYGK